MSKIKYTIKINNNNKDELKRIINTDSAFSLLFDISEEIRTVFKHGNNKKEEYKKVLEGIREDIFESGLMDLYN